VRLQNPAVVCAWDRGFLQFEIAEAVDQVRLRKNRSLPRLRAVPLQVELGRARAPGHNGGALMSGGVGIRLAGGETAEPGGRARRKPPVSAV
jgi:hypothetical protein